MMSTTGDFTQILVAEDEPLNQVILSDFLKEEGYGITMVADGETAWQLLEQSPDQFAAVILDWLMPGMYGIDVLKKMKTHAVLNRVPVIFQTAQNSATHIQEGLEAGAYYYLTKPLHKEQLGAIIKTAIQEFTYQRRLFAETQTMVDTLTLMNTGSFTFSTLEEGTHLAVLLAKIHPASERLALGLLELFTNAIEHGNLGITYEEKTQLMATMTWRQEVNRRLALPENLQKQVRVEFEHTGSELHFLITDQGLGFEWQYYLDFHPENVFDLHGRGIAMANNKIFHHLEFHEPGNEVLAVVKFS